MSDKDILLLGDNWDQLKREKATKAEEGYSVSCFTKSKAGYLMRSGSLFFKHIIDEGVLVSGRSEEYNRLIAEWCPAASYEDEIEDNLDVLEVLAFVPKSPAGLATVVDIVITSIRNIVIRRLAAAGQYVFSWAGVLHTAAKGGQVRAEDVPFFLEARKMKNEYRMGRIRNVSETYVDRLIEGASGVLGGRNKCRFAEHKSILGLPERFADGSYKQLRAVDLLCAEYDFDGSLKSFMDWVRQPSYFSANGPKKVIKATPSL
ncbi:MAG: hypothetical protein L0Z46_07805 [Nitrospiraceae bacterium]|nr:hypothetical protein [Nitrospiraceae bacterium]